jgi:hypothetical protein
VEEKDGENRNGAKAFYVRSPLHPYEYGLPTIPKWDTHYSAVGQRLTFV